MSLLDDALAEVARLKEKAAACDAERARADKFEIGMRDAIRQRDEARDRVESEVAHTRDAIRQYDAAIARADKAEAANENLRKEVARLTAAKLPTAEDYDRLVKERDAYRKAKQENDERFMIERDAAIARADKAEADLEYVTEERDAARRELAETEARAIVWEGRFGTAFKDLTFAGEMRDQYMVERDEARAELVAAKDDLSWRQALYSNLASEIHPSGKDRGYLNLLDDIRALKRDRAELAELRAALNVIVGEGGKGGGS